MKFTLVLCAEGWHRDYIPLCTAAWRKFMPEFDIALAIVSGNPDEETRYARYADQLIVYNDVDDVSRAALAKMARLYCAATQADKTVTLNDIDLVPLQRQWHRRQYDHYKEGKLMLVGTEVYWNTDRGRTPISTMTMPSTLLAELLDITTGTTFSDFVDRWRGSGEHSPDNKADVLNAPYFSDEMLIRQVLLEKQDFVKPYLLMFQRGYDMQRDTLDRACWNLLNPRKLFCGGYLEGHLLKAYKPNIVVNDKQFDEWGFIPGLKPVLDYIGVLEPTMPTALDEAIKLYGEKNAMKCYNYDRSAPCV